jgi:hypothetical protein
MHLVFLLFSAVLLVIKISLMSHLYFEGSSLKKRGYLCIIL